MSFTSYLTIAVLHLAFFGWAELKAEPELRTWPMVFQLAFAWPLTWILFVVVGVSRWPTK